MFKLLHHLDKDELPLDAPIGTAVFKIAKSDPDNEITVHSEEAIVRVNAINLMVLVPLLKILETLGYSRTGKTLLRWKNHKLKTLLIINKATPSCIDITVSCKAADGEKLCDLIRLKKRKGKFHVVEKKLQPNALRTLMRLDRYLHQLSN